MKKFEYGLESLLTLRSHKVKEEEHELGKIIAEKIKREEKIEHYRKEIHELLNAETGNALAYMDARFQRVDMLHKMIDELLQEVSNISEIEDIQRGKLAEATKEEKVLEKHKEKRFDEYIEEVKKDETEFIDEIAGRIAQNNSTDGYKNSEK